MTVLLVIDHFGPGGAQRQLGELGLRLARRGHRVHCFVYFASDTGMGRALTAAGVHLHTVSKASRFSIAPVRALRGLVRGIRPDVVLAYLRTPSAYAALATRGERVPLIVSERSSDDRLPGWLDRCVILSYRWSARVVANSDRQRAWLESTRWLRPGQVLTIPNGVDLTRFHVTPVPARQPELRLLVVAGVRPEKNPVGLARGLIACRARGIPVPLVRWAGPQSFTEAAVAARSQTDRLLADAGLADRWEWLGLRSDVPALLEQHDGLLHPALLEGMPNAIAEGLAAGRPVLAGRIADNARLVSEGVTGFLFDPAVPDSIADAIARLQDMDHSARETMGRRARAFAEEELDMERCVDRYEQLFEEVRTR